MNNRELLNTYNSFFMHEGFIMDELQKPHALFYKQRILYVRR